MEYKTIKASVTAILVEKRSKFIADVAPVADEAEALRFLNAIKSKYPDARHHVFAYLLQSGEQRCSDDGEPQGTGGLPVLNAVTRRGFTNIIAVVTRYFGGILLGAPGLLRAYSGAVTVALDDAEPVVMRRGMLYEISLKYSLATRAEKLVSELGGQICGKAYRENVVIRMILPDEAQAAFLKGLSSLSNGSVQPTLIEETFFS